MNEHIPDIETYTKRLNWYLQEHYPANKKITAEEWNALFLALINQGNAQEETLEKICNEYLSSQIEKINTLVDTTNEHEASIAQLRTDTNKALKDSNYAVITADTALNQVVEKMGTVAYINNVLAPSLHYTRDPQAQLDDTAQGIINLQSQIDLMEQNTNVADVVGTFVDLVNYDKSKITANDIIEVLQDETRANADTYYRLVENAWVYIGKLGSYYTRGESDALLAEKINYADYKDTLSFAESERQKSKNLFKVNNVAGYSITRGGVTATINDDYTITLNGTCTANTWWNLFNGIRNDSDFVTTYQKLYLDTNKTYTYLLKVLSGSYSGTGVDNQIIGASYRQTDGTGVPIEKYCSIRTISTSNIASVISSGVDYLNNGYFRTTGGLTYTNYTFGLMICEGEDTDFQSWNGAIVHEKETADVEHIETIYDKSSPDSAINWGYTSGIKGEVEVANKNFSKYKRLKIYVYAANTFVQYEILLTNRSGLFPDYPYAGSSCVASMNDINYLYVSQSYIDKNKSIFKHYRVGFLYNGTFTERNNDENYIIVRIKGVLL